MGQKSVFLQMKNNDELDKNWQALLNWQQNVDKDKTGNWGISFQYLFASNYDYNHQNRVQTEQFPAFLSVAVSSDGSGCYEFLSDYGFDGHLEYLSDVLMVHDNTLISDNGGIPFDAKLIDKTGFDKMASISGKEILTHCTDDITNI